MSARARSPGCPLEKNSFQGNNNMSDQQRRKNGQFSPAVKADPSVKISGVVNLVVSGEEELSIVEGHVVTAVVRTVVASVWGGVAVVGSGVVMTVVSFSVVVVVT